MYDNYFIIDAPCEIEFEIVKKATGTANLEWKLIPFFYKNLVADDSNAITFAFPKNQICLSNIVRDSMNSRLVQAYTELVQIVK